VLPAVFEETQGAEDVGGLVVERAVERGSDTGEGSEVDDGGEVAAGQGIGTEVAAVEPDTVRERLGLRTVVGRGDLVAGAGEEADDVASDEA
jgi:hypothetical protein